MNSQSIKEYQQLEKYYWWFVGRRRIIERVLEKHFFGRKLNILDWGCGPGGNFGFLKKFGQVLGVDSLDESLRACKEKGITTVVKAGNLDEFMSETKFDLITNFDVLEHITEDEKFLMDAKEFLNPNGHILITVPAYQFLWTRLDDTLGHKRRYTKNEIAGKLKRNGYKVVVASYFVFFLSPAFIFYRMIQKLTNSARNSTRGTLNDAVLEFPETINWLFTRILFLEAWLLSYINFPFGTSVIVLAKKQS